MSFLTVVRTGAAPSAERDARSVLRAARPAEQEVVPAAPVEVLPSVRAELPARGVESYAHLVVTAVGPDEFVVAGHHSDDRHVLAPGTRYARPSLALGELATGRGPGPRDVEDLLWEWSRLQPPELKDWIESLRQDVGDELLRLVVWDTTGFDIPWELLTVPGGGDRPEGPLGTVVAVVRRVAPRGSDLEQAFLEHVCSGSVLAYVDEEMHGDIALLAQYEHDVVAADAFLQALRTEDRPVGLVYLAAHGTWSAEYGRLVLGPLRHRDVSRFPLAGLERWRSLVFLNACHGARLLKDERINDVVGFAEAFLRRGAAVVVGPTGPVETALARRIAGALLSELSAHPDVPVSIALRDIRREAARRLQSPAVSEDDVKAFLYTSMYVCYGNPYVRLSLLGKAS